MARQPPLHQGRSVPSARPARGHCIAIVTHAMREALEHRAGELYAPPACMVVVVEM